MTWILAIIFASFGTMGYVHFRWMQNTTRWLELNSHQIEKLYEYLGSALEEIDEINRKSGPR